MGLIPGLGRSPGEGHGNPLQYSFLENPMHRGAWQAIVHGVAKSWTWLKWLGSYACMLSGEEGSGDRIVFILSQHRFIHYQPDASLLMLTLTSWMRGCLLTFSTIRLLFSPLHSVLFGRKSLFKAHIHRVDCCHLKVEYCLSLSWMVCQQQWQQTNKT